MIFIKIKPSKALIPYVKEFWYLDSEGFIDIIDPVLPSGFSQVAFNLGSSEWHAKTNGNFEKSPSLELMGQQKAPTYFKISGHNIALGISFLPHTAHCFTKDSSHLFTEKVINLDAIFGNTTQIIQEQLLEEPLLPKRIKILEDFLIERICKKQNDNHKTNILQNVLLNIAENQSRYSVRQMAEKVGYSERYIEQLFKDYVGLSPKYYLNILRFHKSLEYLHCNSTSHADISYACGYSDQSHFIREFKKYTGVTPTNYHKDEFPSISFFL